MTGDGTERQECIRAVARSKQPQPKFKFDPRTCFSYWYFYLPRFPQPKKKKQKHLQLLLKGGGVDVLNELNVTGVDKLSVFLSSLDERYDKCNLFCFMLSQMDTPIFRTVSLNCPH